MFQIDSAQLSSGFQKNKFNEEYLYAVNQTTFSQVASSVLFQHEYQDLLSKENMLYIIVGTDSGLLIKYLSDNPPKKGSTFLFIEFTEIIEYTLLDFDADNKRIYLTDYEHWESVARQYELSTYIYLNQVVIIQAICVKDNFLPQYRLLWKQIDQELSNLRWQHIASAGSQIFIQTQIENLNENQFSVIELEGLLKGKTAVLLAGGPSLDLFIDWVEANRDKLIVIAVSRIARRLQKTNIKPDFFAAIDPNQVGFDVSKEVLHFSDDSILLNHYHLSPLILSQWRGPNFFVGPRYPWNTARQPKHIDAPGPTVTNVALRIAVLMGLKRIILLGVDLCFSPEGYSHASSSIEHKAGPMTSHIGQLVTTNDGNTAETENSLLNATKSLSLQAQWAMENHCQFINPSPHAAKIEHVDYIPIDKIELANDILESPLSLIQQRLPEDKQALDLKHYDEIISEIKQTQKKLKRIISLTNKGLTYNKKFFENDTPDKNFNFKIKLDKLEAHLNNDFGSLSNLCRSYGIRAFLRFMKPGNDLDMTNEEIKEWGDVYYEAYNLGAKDLYKLLDQAIIRSENRHLESNNQGQIEALCNFWTTDKSPGRALIFKQQQPDSYINSTKNERKIIAETIETYIEIVDSSVENTSQFAQIKRLTDLNGSEFKAYDFFNRDDQDGLQRMILGLKKHQDKDDKAENLLNLTQAYLYQLQNNEEQAIAHYLRANTGITQEAVLKQLALLYLDSNQLVQAEVALYNLSCLSAAYLPKLANLYKILKRYKDALDTYVSYLDLFPEDILVLFKLGALYQQLENNEGAQFVYQHILSIEPENAIAKTCLKQVEG